MTDPALTRLLARQEIEDRMLCYARAVDRRDWPTMRATFHADAEIHHGDHRGDVEGLVSLIMGRQSGITVSLHLLTNCLVEFVAADHALVETYLLAHQWLDEAAAVARGLAPRPGGAGVTRESWGRYLDEFTLRDGAWRVQRRQTLFESLVDRPGDGRSGPPAHWLQPQADATDPLLLARARLGLG